MMVRVRASILASAVREGFFLCLSVTVLLTVGCGVSMQGASDSAGIPGVPVPISGRVHGGQQPVTGATVTLWTVGSTGYGSAAHNIATTTTDANGNFSFPNTYTCTGTYAYLTAAGGNPGVNGGTNSAIKMLAVLTGPTAAEPIVENDLCATVESGNPFVVINEISTVAAIYGLAQFFNPTTESIGASSTNTVGLLNAFNNIAYLMNIPAGTVNANYKPYGYNQTNTNDYNVMATPEQSKIYLIADILAACVNTTGPTSSACTALFGAAVPPPSPGTTTLGSTFVYPPAATDTLQAAYFMAVNPINATTAGIANTNNMTALLNLAPSVMPFVPAATSASDWTVALTFSSTSFCNDTSCPVYAISAPTYLALNGEGDVYFISSNSSTSQVISALMPYGGEGFSHYDTIAPIAGLTFDTGSGTETGTSAAYKLYTGHTTGTGATSRENYEFNLSNYFASGTDGAYFVDSNATTVPINGTQYSGDSTNIYFPASTNGYVYGVPNAFQNHATPPSPYVSGPSTTTPTTLTALNNGHSITGFTAASDVKVDQASNVWVTAPGANAVYSMPVGNSLTITTGATPTAYTTGLYAPTGIAIDHLNDAWVVNSAGGTPSTGYIAEITAGGVVNADTVSSHGGINAPTAIAIDGAGNVWVASQTVSELALIGGTVTALSPSAGFSHSYNSPGNGSIAIDMSGNVWVANSGGYASATVPGTLTMILGAAVPAVQSLPYAVQQGKLGTLP